MRTGSTAARAALAKSILHGLYLHVVPVRPEAAENATVMRHVAIPVGSAFPDAHRSKVGRLKRSHMPLVDGIVRNAVEAHFAVAPWLRASPLDAIIKILGLARREVVDISGRRTAAARIDAYADVILRHPLFRIDDFPALEFIGRAGGNIRVLFGHALPLVRIAVLKGESFRVRTIGEDDRVISLGDRPKDIGAQDDSVIHRDWHVPFDAHAISYFRPMLHHLNRLIQSIFASPMI